MNPISEITSIVAAPQVNPVAKLMLIRVILDAHEFGAREGIPRTHKDWARALKTTVSTARRAGRELVGAGLVIRTPVRDDDNVVVSTRMKFRSVSL